MARNMTADIELDRNAGPLPFVLGRPSRRPRRVLLFLHGKNERCTRRDSDEHILGRLARYGSPVARFQERSAALEALWQSFLLVAPVFVVEREGETWRWDPNVVDEVLAAALTVADASDCDVVATGFSRGGLGLWDLERPKRLVAVDSQGLPNVFPDKPIWIHYAEGSFDFIVHAHDAVLTDWPVASGKTPPRKVDKRLKTPMPARGSDPVAEHVRICAEAYANPNVYDWLLATGPG
jgi:hypothetical protein